MGRIVCDECRKVYDFDRDDFCPRCGAFNQPVKTWGVDAQGNVVRVDGVSEQNHAGSFVHREVHKEKAVRRAAGMDWKGTRGQTRRPPSPTPVKPKPAQDRGQAQNKARNVFWLIVLFAAFSFLIQLLSLLF